ncbi:MAG: glycosyltransferase family 4 protein [Opitutae bacterium]|nr:glycosyltransferase family 4 protein [Opitutae bacterium]
MKVLWLCNQPLPAMCEHLGVPSNYGGSWMVALSGELAKLPDVELMVISTRRKIAERREHREPNGILHVVLPELVDSSAGLLRHHIVRQQISRVWPGLAAESALRACVAEIQRWMPDVIHIFGTERFWGEVAACTEVPCIVHIQGILTAYQKFWWFQMPWWERLQYPAFWIRWLQFSAAAKKEREVYLVNRRFFGRTDWDRERLRELNPWAEYVFMHEAIRPAFFVRCWRLAECKRFRLFSTSSPFLWKGGRTLLHAFALVRARHPEAELRVAGVNAGHPIGRQLVRLAKKLGVADGLHLLGQMDAAGIVAEMLRAHVFVLASAIENSPNSLFEAQAVGMPVVSTMAGGVSSYVEEARTGLLCPVGDSRTMAAQIVRLTGDDAIAQRIAAGARTQAHDCHHPVTVARRQLESYRRLAERRIPPIAGAPASSTVSPPSHEPSR